MIYLFTILLAKSLLTIYQLACPGSIARETREDMRKITHFLRSVLWQQALSGGVTHQDELVSTDLCIGDETVSMKETS